MRFYCSGFCCIHSYQPVGFSVSIFLFCNTDFTRFFSHQVPECYESWCPNQITRYFQVISINNFCYRSLNYFLYLDCKSNLAQGKVAGQVSTFPYQGATKALDGNGFTRAVTWEADWPYWYVDLAQRYTVGHVRLIGILQGRRSVWYIRCSALLCCVFLCLYHQYLEDSSYFSCKVGFTDMRAIIWPCQCPWCNHGPLFTKKTPSYWYRDSSHGRQTVFFNPQQ